MMRDPVQGGNQRGLGCSPVSCYACSDIVEPGAGGPCLMATRDEASAPARHTSIQQSHEERPDRHGTDAALSAGQGFRGSKTVYEALGFEKVFDGEVAIFDAGSGGFLLQRYYQKAWAENFMMQIMVGDLDAWWAHIESRIFPGDSARRRPSRRRCSRGDFVSPTWSIRRGSSGISRSAPRMPGTTGEGSFPRRGEDGKGIVRRRPGPGSWGRRH